MRSSACWKPWEHVPLVHHQQPMPMPLGSLMLARLYDGNLDIIYNHSGVLDMIADLSWSGAVYIRVVYRFYMELHRVKLALS